MVGSHGAGSAAFIIGTIGSGQAIYAFGLGATLVLQATLLVFSHYVDWRSSKLCEGASDYCIIH